MGKIVGIRLRPQGKVYDFDAGHFVLSPGDRVIVETVQGLAFGTVIKPPMPVGEHEPKAALKKVYRLANEKDVEQYRKSLGREESAFAYCLECINKLRLKMNLVSVESLFEGTKLTFYYTADGRVDFRELVKMLVKAYKVRIEMRQIGVRNRAKMAGGMGRCGQELCCSGFMNEFQPVSVRMAKDQGLSLNPSKISGLCGRLMCCLAFEHGTYCHLKGKFPDCGKVVRSKAGCGKVVRQNVLKESVTIQLDDQRELDVGLDEIKQEQDT
jgi:cell fate regulator YaaT (PSP1 superfamily)